MRAIWLSALLLLAACASPPGPAPTSSAAGSAPSPPLLATLDLLRVPGAAAAGADGLWIADYDRGDVTHVSGGAPLKASTGHGGDPRSPQPGCQAGSGPHAPTRSFIIPPRDLPARLAGRGRGGRARRPHEEGGG